MKLHISSNGHTLSNRLRNFVAERVEKAVQHFGNRVSRVDVALDNQDGLVDRSCRVVLSVSGRNQIVATGESENILAAIAQAMERAKRGLSRSIDRTRDTRRYGY